MIRNVGTFLVGIIFFLIFSLASNAAGKSPKWIFHVVHEGQTIEKIVRAYSILYDVNLENFLKWNKINKYYVPEGGEIFAILNKPSKQMTAARRVAKKVRNASTRRMKREVTAEKNRAGETETRNKVNANPVQGNQIFNAIRFASEQTGVRQAFLAGMLYVETGLGKNTGSCHYCKSRMGLPEQALFEQICQELGYDPDVMAVSCPQSGQRGGAMGVAQFIPSTWEVYKNRVGKIVGKKLPDPWDPLDASVAMALKIANDAPGTIQHQRLSEINAAKLYLSGTTDSQYNNHAKKVLVAAKKFEEIF